MNYFLPLHCGAPDMANNKKFFFNYLIKNNTFTNINEYKILNKNKFSFNNKFLYKKDIENRIGSYLAGLIEGDGYISITNANRIILGITFNIKDKPLAEKLLKYIGKGFIAKRKSNSIELRFSSKKSLFTIIQLINGKFRTPKIDQLHKLIDWMNKNHIQPTELKLNKLPLDISEIYTNN
jgi:hypothetical protein